MGPQWYNNFFPCISVVFTVKTSEHAAIAVLVKTTTFKVHPVYVISGNLYEKVYFLILTCVW